MIRAWLLLLIAASAMSFSALAAETVQPLESIRAAAEHAARTALQPLGGELRIGAIQIDPRLRMAACATPLSAQLDSPAAARNIVAVSCRQPLAWTLRIPVHAEVWRRVAVNTQAVQRGTVISADQVLMQTQEILSLTRGYFDDSAQVIGQQASRNLKANTVLHPGMIEAPRLVKRGDTVLITAADGRIAVRTQGIALQDGIEGATVQVRNPRSGRVITGAVTARGTVSVIR